MSWLNEYQHRDVFLAQNRCTRVTATITTGRALSYAD